MFVVEIKSNGYNLIVSVGGKPRFGDIPRAGLHALGG